MVGFYKLQVLYCTNVKKSYSIQNSLTGHRPPTTDHQSTDVSSTDHQPPTHRQVLYQPTNHRQLTTDQLISVPPTNQPPTTDSPTGPPTQRSLTHRLTNSPTLLQLTNNSLTHESYFSRVTIGPILSITNFNSSFGMSTIDYWNRKIIHIIYKMIGEKERW